MNEAILEESPKEEAKILSKEERMAAFEAVLFAMGNSVPADVLSEALGLSLEEIEETARALQEKYERPDSGLELIRLEDAWQLRTKRAYFEALRKTAESPVRPTMTGTLLEVLSIIAYKQPVTRQEIADIRGISSDYAVNRLVEFGLIQECGRQDAPGRAILFGTTEDFLRQFGLSSVRELPQVSIPEDEEDTESPIEEETDK
ncbi:MAG: SMC-Scp complex subunit ScpB [Lachnospiraceae bacterium]|nr:SMC-Scp complex subunit ScpB [Lachnospiraceae bacterium]